MAVPGGRVRVLLVNPPPVVVAEPWYDTPSWGRHGLACLAGYVRDTTDVFVVDAKLERLSFAEVAARARALRPDVVGITAFTNEIKAAARVAERVKAALPGVLTVIGGVHVSTLPERTLREFPAFDVGCVGEGERTLKELCAALAAGAPLASVDGLVLRGEDGIVRTPPRAPIDDLDELPLPAWDLFPRAEEYWVMTQRGCPFTCRFCVNPNGRLPRAHGVPRVVAELRDVVDRWAPRKIWFADEIFTVDVPRTHALLDATIAAGLADRMPFWAESHVRFVDEPLLRKMRAAGCREIALGIETGDDAALRKLGKGTDVASVRAAFAAARRAGLDTIGFFIFGHPGETLRSMRATVELAVALNPKIPIFGVMVPYPGTEVARLAARGEGGYRLITDDWDAFNKQVGGALELAGVPRRAIELFQLRAYVEVFARNARWRDLAAFAWARRVAGLQILRNALARAPATRPPDASFLADMSDATPRLRDAQRADMATLRRTARPRSVVRPGPPAA